VPLRPWFEEVRNQGKAFLASHDSNENPPSGVNSSIVLRVSVCRGLVGDCPGWTQADRQVGDDDGHCTVADHECR